MRQYLPACTRSRFVAVSSWGHLLGGLLSAEEWQIGWDVWGNRQFAIFLRFYLDRRLTGLLRIFRWVYSKLEKSVWEIAQVTHQFKTQEGRGIVISYLFEWYHGVTSSRVSPQSFDQNCYSRPWESYSASSKACKWCQEQFGAAKASQFAKIISNETVLTDDHSKVFNYSKDRVADTITLAFPKKYHETCLFTDASDLH